MFASDFVLSLQWWKSFVWR